MASVQDPNVTMRYLGLADELLTAADERPEERLRLSNAAGVAVRLAKLPVSDDETVTRWAEKAATLLTPALNGPIDAAVVASAQEYTDMAHTRCKTVLAWEVDI